MAVTQQDSAEINVGKWMKETCILVHPDTIKTREQEPTIFEVSMAWFLTDMVIK